MHRCMHDTTRADKKVAIMCVQREAAATGLASTLNEWVSTWRSRRRNETFVEATADETETRRCEARPGEATAAGDEARRGAN